MKCVDEEGIIKRKEFGEWLRLVRLHKQISQGDVAKEIGANTANFISKIERGVSAVPVDRIGELARGYQVEELVFAEAVFKHFMPEVWKWIERFSTDNDFKNRERQVLEFHLEA